LPGAAQPNPQQFRKRINKRRQFDLHVFRAVIIGKAGYGRIKRKFLV